MFAKIFESIYDGTLADHWQAMVTFQQFLVLGGAQGVVDMTPQAIHRRTGLPTEIILAGIAVLEQPDPQSRSKALDGRRIVRLDDGREWGWFIVNHAAYREKISRAEKQEADRIRIAAKRAAGKVETAAESPPVAECRDLSQGVANVAYTDTELEAEEAKAFSTSGKRTNELSREAPPTDPVARAELEPAAGQEPPEPEPPPSTAGLICRALKSLGITHVNPSHPALLRLIAAGATVAEFENTARELGKGNLPYICAAIEGRRRDAANAGPVATAPRKPTPASFEPYKPERRARGDPEAPLPTEAKELFKSLGFSTPASPTTP